MPRVAHSAYQLTFWAKVLSGKDVTPEVSFLDVDEGYDWVGGAEVALTNEWQHIAMEPVYTTADQKGHEIQIAFLIGLNQAVFHFDDIQLYELDVPSPPPPSPPPPPYYLMWLDAEGGPKGAQTVVKAGAAGELTADLSSTAAAHEGTYGFEVSVAKTFDEDYYGMLSLPAFLVTDHERLCAAPPPPPPPPAREAAAAAARAAPPSPPLTLLPSPSRQVHAVVLGEGHRQPEAAAARDLPGRRRRLRVDRRRVRAGARGRRRLHLHHHLSLSSDPPLSPESPPRARAALGVLAPVPRQPGGAVQAARPQRRHQHHGRRLRRVYYFDEFQVRGGAILAQFWRNSLRNSLTRPPSPPGGEQGVRLAAAEPAVAAAVAAAERAAPAQPRVVRDGVDQLAGVARGRDDGGRPVDLRRAQRAVRPLHQGGEGVRPGLARAGVAQAVPAARHVARVRVLVLGARAATQGKTTSPKLVFQDADDNYTPLKQVTLPLVADWHMYQVDFSLPTCAARNSGAIPAQFWRNSPQFSEHPITSTGTASTTASSSRSGSARARARTRSTTSRSTSSTSSCRRRRRRRSPPPPRRRRPASSRCSASRGPTTA